MVPRAKTTQSWPLRPWRSQRKMYVVIYRGALRRRIRRLVRSRLFNNVRTATRNLDLPLAIATPPTGSPALCRDRNDSGSVWRQQGGPLSPLGHSGRPRTRRKHRSFRNTCAVTKRSRGPDAASIAHTQCRPEAPRALHRACWATKCIPSAVGLAAPQGELYCRLWRLPLRT